MYDGICADGYRAVDVDRGRVFECDPGRHETGVFSLSRDATHFCQVDSAVDTSDIVGVGDRHRVHHPAAFAKDGHEIRQVIFPLDVRRCDTSDGIEETIKGERINPGVDFPNPTFGCARVLLLNDADQLVLRPDDPSVSMRVRNNSGHCRCCRASRRVPLGKLAESIGREQWDVTRKQNEDAPRLSKRRLGRKEGVGRSQLGRLHDKTELRPVRQCGSEYFAAMPQDNGGGLRRKCGGDIENVIDHRPARHVVKHFRPPRLHARPLARGKDHDVDGGRHAQLSP